MFILFALVVMRMTGAVVFNPILGRTNLPRTAKAAFIFSLSLLLYLQAGGVLQHQPSSMLEYGFMLVKELLVGFTIGFSMEISFSIVRFSSAIIDYTMGLSMAQVYDPQYNTQMTITSGLFYAFLALLFLATDGHVRLISLFFTSARFIPFGEVAIRQELYLFMIELFKASIVTGLQIAFPLIAMEMVTEAAVGILMRMIPQINVFAVNFQVKIIVGLMMLMMMFNPMADKVNTIIQDIFVQIQQLLDLLA